MHLPAHPPLFDRYGGGACLDDDRRIGKLIQTQYFYRLQNVIFIIRIVAELLIDLFDHFDDLIHILPISHTDIENIPGEVLGHIGHHIDMTVRHVVHISCQIAENGRFEVYLFNQSAFAGNLHDISHPDLIFQQDEESADHIFDETLSAKTHCQANDSSGREEGPN